MSQGDTEVRLQFFVDCAAFQSIFTFVELNFRDIGKKPSTQLSVHMKVVFTKCVQFSILLRIPPGGVMIPIFLVEAIQRDDKLMTPSAIEILSREPLVGGDHGFLSERLLVECGGG